MTTDTVPPICGAEPPVDWVGDCWCTLQPDHTGPHHCEPCTERHGAPGWEDPIEPVRLEIDLNDRTPDNLVPAHLPDGVTVQPGQQVVAYEPEDQVAAPAVVRRVELGQALLDVDWNAMRDEASSRHIVGHATIGIDVAATQATEPPSIELRAVPLDAWNALIEIAQWVSRGRSAAFIPDENLGRVYPDAKARRALGALHDAGLLKRQEQQ